MSILQLLNETNEQLQQKDNKIYGVVIGIVKDIRDPDNFGRVKVNFPWLAEKDAETVSIGDGADRAHSYWARLATFMAGSGRGSYFMPEEEDEVLVAFEHGELDRPIILGALWNTVDKPPEEMDKDGKNDIRAIHTRSGHKIVFNDSEDKPSILIIDNTGDNSIAIDSANNNMDIKVKNDLTIEVGGKITINAGKDISIETKANLSAKATGSGSIETNQKLDIKSSQGVAVDGSLQADLKAAKVSVNGSGITEIKGGLVKIN